MKVTKMAYLAGVMVATLVVAPLQAAVLITVDVSDPTAVTFTATGSASQVEDSSSSVRNGIDLLAFFSSEPSYAYGEVLGNLTPPSERGVSYNNWSIDGDRSGNNRVHLNLLGWTGAVYPAPEDALQNFTTTAAVFTGAGKINLSTLTTAFPAPGTSGDIIVGSGVFGSRAVIGQWTVVGVPEPASLTLLAVGAAALLRRRKV
jgi:hypothetical protein